jgi:hypothetical protein
LAALKGRVKYLEACLNKMAKLFAEHRSDVEEDIHYILDGNDLDSTCEFLYVESRFVKFTFRGTEFAYDTYTTQPEVCGEPHQDEICSEASDGWFILNCDYED